MKKIISIFLLLPAIVLTSCMNNDDVYLDNFKLSTALSIFVKDGKVGITSLVNENNIVTTEYWIDSTKSSAAELKKLLPEGNSYRTSIDNYNLATTVYKKADGSLAEYKFLRHYSLDPADQLLYFKDGNREGMDTTALGSIQSVDATNEEVFAGFFGRREYFENSNTFVPYKPFYWDGKDNLVLLPMPANYFYFQGVSCIHKSGEDVYVGGNMDFPMYWKNTQMVRLSDKYGEVNQIKTQGSDVYVVGFYNKKNSNSTGHTACYWINNELVELEDNAIAYSIFIEGKDVYVAGAVGRYDVEYRACFWKNGKRYMLPD